MEVVRALVRRGDHVLLVRRARGDTLPGRLELPGGKADPGETRTQALARELHEETGLRLRGRPHLVREHRTRSPRGRPLSILTYACEAEGELRLSDEHEEARWHPRGAAAPREATDAARMALSDLSG